MQSMTRGDVSATRLLMGVEQMVDVTEDVVDTLIIMLLCAVFAVLLMARNNVRNFHPNATPPPPNDDANANANART